MKSYSYSYKGNIITASTKKEAITKIVASEHSRILKSRIKKWIPASYKVKDIDLDSFEICHPNCKNIVATEDYQALLDELRRYAKSIKFELSKGKECIIVTVLPLGDKVVAFNKDNIRENTKLFYEDMNKGEFIYNYRIDNKFQDFIDRTLEDEIHDVIRSDKNLITRCIENRVKNYSIVWSALVQIFEDVRKRWNLKSTVTNELIKNWFAYNDTDYKTSLKKIVDNLTEFREELRESELFKKGDKVNISGDISNGDYNCRVSSTGVVEENQKTPNSKIRVTIDEIDGDRNVSMLVNPNIVTLASTKNIIVAKKSYNESDYFNAIVKELTNSNVEFSSKTRSNSIVIKFAGRNGGVLIYLDRTDDDFLEDLRMNYADVVKNGSDKEYIIRNVSNKTPKQVASELKKVIVDLFNWYQLNQKIMYKYDMR